MAGCRIGGNRSGGGAARRGPRLALLVLAVLAAVSACGGTPAGSADRAEITWLVEQGWNDQWNVLRAEGSSFYLSQILAGTTPQVGDFDVEGEWQWNRDLLVDDPMVVADDPLTFTYRLREEAVWSDGTPIGVDDFRFNWFHNSGRDDHCVGCEPQDTTGWSDVASIDADASGRIVTITYQPGVRDPEWFAHFFPSPYPAHLAEAAGFDWRTPEGMGASSTYFRDTTPTWSGGPYLLDEVVPDVRAVLVPNPRWYGATAPALDRIVKEVVASPADWPLAVTNGELDGGATLAFDPDVAERLADTAGVTVTVGSGGATWEHVDLNLASPALGDVALRRAIFTALDIDDARRRLFGDDLPPPRTNPVFAETAPFHEDLLTPTGYGTGDLATARRILEAAGYEGTGPGQSLSRDGHAVPALRFAYLSGHPTRGTFVELAQHQLGEIGLTVTPVAVPGPQFGSTLLGGEFDLVILSLAGSPLFTHTPLQLFHSTSSVNFAGVDDPGIDLAVEAVFGGVDLEAAARQANHVVELVLDQASMLPLWDNLSFFFVRDGYVGVGDNPQSALRAMHGIGAWAPE